MIMAVTTIAILSILAVDLIYETEVYNRIVHNEIDQLRAQNLAKSSLKIALLQIIATNRASKGIQSLGGGLSISQRDIDNIWKTPLILPPPLPKSASLITKGLRDKLTKDLGINGSIFIRFEGESGKINLNQMVWKPPQSPPRPPANPPSDSEGERNGGEGDEEEEDFLTIVRETINKAADDLIAQNKEKDEIFRLKYENITGRALIQNILAWIDPQTQVDGDGLPKEQYYRELPEPYHIKNAPLYSISELSMVKDFDDELVDFFSQHFTATLTKGFNINTGSEPLIKALFPVLKDQEIWTKFNEYREYPGFATSESFWTYMKENLDFTNEDEEEFKKSGITIITRETAFRVTIESKSGLARKVWLAYIGNPPPDLNSSRQEENRQKIPSIVYLKTD